MIPGSASAIFFGAGAGGASTLTVDFLVIAGGGGAGGLGAGGAGGFRTRGYLPARTAARTRCAAPLSGLAFPTTPRKPSWRRSACGRTGAKR